MATPIVKFFMEETKPDLIKFTYLVDPECVKRTVCVARRIREGKIHIAFSINKSVMLDAEVRPVRITKIDQKLFGGVRMREKEKRIFILEKFNKKKAREVSVEKLNNGPMIIDRIEGVPPIQTVMEHMTNDISIPKKIRDICNRSINLQIHKSNPLRNRPSGF
jgi:hypothetical protein